MIRQVTSKLLRNHTLRVNSVSFHSNAKTLNLGTAYRPQHTQFLAPKPVPKPFAFAITRSTRFFHRIASSISLPKNTSACLFNQQKMHSSNSQSAPNVTYLPDPVISPKDSRKYRAIKLDNQLRILLISDEEAEKGAAAMSVGVGYFCDPEDIPGLAHFLEHMLFMGTEKYPDENSYSKFLTEHSGSSNAFTSSEDTNYFFDVSAEHMWEALDRFAQFFIGPLFTESGTDREMHAVNSENDKNLQSDGWRLHQLHKSICNPAHPFSKFGTGNLLTLTQSKNVREQLLDFHKQYYSANIMNLVVLAKEPLNVIEEKVTNLFYAIKNTNIHRPKFDGNVYRKDDMKCVLEVVPVKELRQIEFKWKIDPQHVLYLSKPSSYVSHLLGHEGAGSILSLLKSQGWSSSCVAGISEETQDFTHFALTVDLTDSALNHINDIASIVFNYLNLLKSEEANRWIWEEMKKLMEMDFQFKEKEKPINYVMKLASAMHLYPPEHVISHSNMLEKFDPEAIKKILDLLVPENMIITIIAKKFEKDAIETEKWYGTKYNKYPIKDEDINNWVSSQIWSRDLALPKPNEFIPSDFTIKTPEKHSKYPYLLKQTKFSNLFFKCDDIFDQPKGIVKASFKCPVSYYSPRNAVRTRLFLALLADQLNEFAYDAEVAGLSYALEPRVCGFEFTCKGYNHKLNVLVEKVMEKMRHFTVDLTRYDSIHDLVARSIRNLDREQPHNLVYYFTTLCLEHKRWTNNQYIEVVDSIAADEINNFVPEILSKLQIDWLVHGNFSENDALRLVQSTEEVLKSNPLLDGEPAEYRVTALPEGAMCLYQSPPTDPDNNNSAICTYFQIGNETHEKENVILSLYSQILSEPFFNILRTKEQLGYLVHSSAKRDHTAVNGMNFLIQSSKNPKHLDHRIEEFLATVPDMIKEMSENEFNNHKESLILRLIEKDQRLGQETGRYWGEIVNGLFRFDKVLREVEELKKLEKADVLSFHAKHIARESPNRRKLSCQIYGNPEEIPSTVAEKTQTPQEDVVKGDDGINGVVKITNFFEFKRSMPLLPLPSSSKPIHSSL